MCINCSSKPDSKLFQPYKPTVPNYNIGSHRLSSTLYIILNWFLDTLFSYSKLCYLELMSHTFPRYSVLLHDFRLAWKILEEININVDIWFVHERISQEWRGYLSTVDTAPVLILPFLETFLTNAKRSETGHQTACTLTDKSCILTTDSKTSPEQTFSNIVVTVCQQSSSQAQLLETTVLMLKFPACHLSLLETFNCY